MSKIVNIKVDVYVSADIEFRPPAYRIFVDGDLLVERDFYIDFDRYIEESIVVELSEDKMHTIECEPLNDYENILRFENVRVDGRPEKTEFYI